jgi:hypothetical protein
MSEAWSFTMANSYNHTQTLSTVVAEVSSLTNQVALNRSSGSKSIQPKVFYNIFHQPTFSYTIRGAGLSFNQFNVKTGTRFSTTIEGGVNTPVNIPNSSETSYMQWSSLAFFKTVSLNARYLSGTYGYVPPAAGGSTTPNQQLFMSSAQHQYVLRNGKVMIQTGANYFYNNAFKQHSITLTPDIYYFSKDGWRFRVSFNYNLISSIPLKNNYGTQPTSEDAQTRMTTQNTFISLGIRKEFNLPIPFKKVKFCDVKFVAFYDVNGNGIKDNSEKELENVVVRVGEDEVITNSAGEAHMRNIDIKKHSIAAFALDNQDGWFPNIEDSMVVFKHKTMNIPFVKGIRIKGKITIDRESINADADEPFDLSRIRITASSQKQISVLTDFNGSFEFYLPYGKYVLTMDEGVLGSRYKIARNNYEIDVNKDADGMVISYLIIEKKRKIVKKVFSQPLPVEPPKPENKPVIKTPRKAK